MIRKNQLNLLLHFQIYLHDVNQQTSKKQGNFRQYNKVIERDK